MNKYRNYIFGTLFFLGAFSIGKAQDSSTVETPPETTDTVTGRTSLQAEQKHYFNEVTDVQKVNERKIPDSIVTKIKSDKDYWYVNTTPEKKKPSVKQNNGVFQQQWFTTVFWFVLVGGFIALLLWFLSSGNISLFRRSKKIANDKDENTEPVTENIFELNYEKEINSAVAAADYRLAIRLLYLQTLKQLSERNIINYSNQKTNSDYLFQLAETGYYKNFFRLTRNFEYTWYGQFQLSRNAFETMQKDFLNFKQQLRQ